MNSATCIPGAAEAATAPSDPTLGDVMAALKRIEASLKSRAEADAALLRKAAADMANVGRWMVARHAAVMPVEIAAAYIGISPEALGRLSAAVPSLRPVEVAEGVVVWRRADLDRFLAALPQ